MKRILLKTGDGSFTLQLPDWDEQYHSKHGAIAEALHVFIKEGLQFIVSQRGVDSQQEDTEISILEIGFGTGLNCFLTLLEAENTGLNIRYTAVEAYPLEMTEINSLNYASLLNSSQDKFLELHNVPWEADIPISEHFTLKKKQLFFEQIEIKNSFDLIYFDAFGIRVQPELWTDKIFQKMYDALRPNGMLTTYAANGSARRAMQAIGFSVERIPGPPGKKEMMRATKNNSV